MRREGRAESKLGVSLAQHAASADRILTRAVGFSCSAVTLPRAETRSAASSGHAAGLTLAGALLLVCGCRSLGPSLPPVNLQEPGWTVHQGQAVWYLPNSSRDIAGDLVVATRANGQSFVQFSKTPFPLVVAQQTTNSWEAAFPPQNRHYSRRGAPPRRIIWLYLPRVLAGQKPPPNWSWQNDGTGWRLENHARGESVEGFFTQ